MANQSLFITRKEIANANELSEATIRRREHAIGLDRCRDRNCEKPVRYESSTAAQLLKRNGYRSP